MKNITLKYVVLFSVAFALRVGSGMRHPNELVFSDASSFDEISWNVASQGHYAMEGHPTTMRPPSYVLFLAGIYKVAGHRLWVARLAQAVLGTVLVYILMQIARRFSSDPRLPWITGWIAACYPFFIYYDGQVIADSFLTFFLALSFWLFFRWQERPASGVRALLCGLSFSAVCLTKSIFISVFALLLIVEGGFALQSPDRRRIFRSIAAAGFIFLIPLLGWGARNQRVFGRFMLDSHGGRTVVETIMFYQWCKRGIFPSMFENHPIHLAAKTLNEADRDAFYFAKTKQFIREHPALYFRQTLGNAKNFWRFYPRQDLVYREGRRTLTLISLLSEPFLLLFGLAGAIQARRRWRTIYPIYAAIILLSIVHALTTGEMRYRLPIMPYAIIFSTYAMLGIRSNDAEEPPA